MEFRVFFKHMESSLPLYAYAQKKLGERLEKYACQPIEAQVTFSVEALQHIARCHVRTRSGHVVQVENADENMYACVDILADKLDKQLRRFKDRLTSHKSRRLSDDQPRWPLNAFSLSDEETIDAADVIQFENARRRQAGRAVQHGSVSLQQ